MITISLLPLQLPQNEVFQPLVLNFFTKLFQQEKNFPTIFWQPKIYLGQLPPSPIPLIGTPLDLRHINGAQPPAHWPHSTYNGLLYGPWPKRKTPNAWQIKLYALQIIHLLSGLCVLDSF